MKEKDNINARNVLFFQILNLYSTDNTAKTLCCLPTTWRRGRRQTDNKQQRKEKMNGRGMRKWIGTAGSPGTGSRKSYQTSGNKHLFKYINIYNRVYQRYTGPEKEREQGETWIKHGCGKFKKRNTGTEGLLKLKRIKQNAKEKKRSGMQKERTKAEMQKMRNAEMIYERRERIKKNMQNTDIKEKDSLHTAEFMKIS